MLYVDVDYSDHNGTAHRKPLRMGTIFKTFLLQPVLVNTLVMPLSKPPGRLKVDKDLA